VVGIYKLSKELLKIVLSTKAVCMNHSYNFDLKKIFSSFLNTFQGKYISGHLLIHLGNINRIKLSLISTK
jgi:hypothetical protein